MKIVTYKPGTKVITQAENSKGRQWLPRYLNKQAIVLGRGRVTRMIEIQMCEGHSASFDVYPEEISLFIPHKIKKVIWWK